MRSPKAHPRPATVVAAAAAAVAMLLAGLAVASAEDAAPAAAAGTSACSEAGTQAEDASIRELRKSATCLINRERREHGFDRVGRQRALQKAAQRHARVMVKTNCFAHRCPGEPKLEGRLRRAGYFDGAKRWKYAESTGCAASAEAMVESWLESTFHRLNLLGSKFDDVGIGVVSDSPRRRCEKGFATFTAVFGWRKT